MQQGSGQVIAYKFCSPEEQGVESTFLPEWSAHAKPSDRSRDRTKRCGMCGIAATIARRKTHRYIANSVHPLRACSRP